MARLIHYRPQIGVGANVQAPRLAGQIQPADDGSARAISAALGAGEGIIRVLAKDYERENSARIEEQVMKGEEAFEAWKQKYMQENQGKNALNAQADFSAKYDAIIKERMEEFGGKGNEVYRDELLKKLRGRQLMAFKAGGEYQERETKAWETSVFRGKLSDYELSVANNYDDPDMLAMKRNEILGLWRRQNPGLDETELRNKLIEQEQAGREKGYIERVEGYIAGKNWGAAEAALADVGKAARQRGGGADLNVAGQSVAKMSQEAIAKGVRYVYGAKGEGATDCSGWVAKTGQAYMAEANEKAGREVFDVKTREGFKKAIGEGGAAGAIAGVGRMTGKIYEGGEILANAGPGMLIGVSHGEKAKGRFRDIGHIGQVFAKDGKLYVSEASSGAGGIKVSKLAEFVAGYERRGIRLSAVNLSALADSGEAGKSGGGGQNAGAAKGGWQNPKVARLREKIEAGRKQELNEVRAEMDMALSEYEAKCQDGLNVEAPLDAKQSAFLYGDKASEVMERVSLMGEYAANLARLKDMNPGERREMLAKIRPEASSENYRMKAKVFEMLGRANEHLEKEQAKDGLGWLVGNDANVAEARAKFWGPDGVSAENWQNYVKVLQAGANMRGIGLSDEAGRMQVLAKEDAKFLAKILSESENPAELAASLANVMGGDWPLALRQMSKDLPPVMQLMTSVMSPEASRAVMAAHKDKEWMAVRLNHLNVTPGELGAAVSDACYEMGQTFAAGGNGVMVGEMAKAVEVAAVDYMYRKGMPMEGAIGQALSDVIAGRYEVVKQMSGGNKGFFGKLGKREMPPMRVPKEAYSEDVGLGISAATGQMDMAEVAYIEVNGAKVEMVKEQYKSFLEQNAYWVTDKGEGGAVLFLAADGQFATVYGKDGKPIRRSWQEFAEIGKKARQEEGKKDLSKSGGIDAGMLY